MKKMALACIVLGMMFGGCSKEKIPAAKSQEAAAVDLKKIQAQVNGMWNLAEECSQAGKYAEALLQVRKLREISDRLSDRLIFREKVLDFHYFLLMKNGDYREALETALALEALAQKLSTRQSPWYCLKIAEAYLGQKDAENALAWIEKAVFERNFIRQDIFALPVYSPLKGNPRFIKAIAAVEQKIGIDRPAKEFSLQLLDGTLLSLSALRGKVVLIDFWDVNCSPCRKEMPNLKKLHLKYAAKGLVIVGISLDTDKKLLQEYLRKESLEWKMACTFQGWNDPTAKLYQINNTPSSWLVDRRGMLRHVDLRGEELAKAVKALL